jgi:hypothetical protein
MLVLHEQTTGFEGYHQEIQCSGMILTPQCAVLRHSYLFFVGRHKHSELKPRDNQTEEIV